MFLPLNAANVKYPLVIVETEHQPVEDAETAQEIEAYTQFIGESNSGREMFLAQAKAHAMEINSYHATIGQSNALPSPGRYSEAQVGSYYRAEN
jgi:hypothetical protein